MRNISRTPINGDSDLVVMTKRELFELERFCADHGKHVHHLEDHQRACALQDEMLNDTLRRINERNGIDQGGQVDE